MGINDNYKTKLELEAEKINGEVDESLLQYFWVDGYKGRLTTENVFTTSSGKYIIVTHPITPEEEMANEKDREEFMASMKKEENARIQAAMALSGYILIAWEKMPTPGSLLGEDIHAFYLPKTGPRFVYIRIFNVVKKKNNQGAGYKTIEPEKENGFTRWSRKEISDKLKKYKTKFNLCAPLWLLTSIPDPRPRFLAEIEESVFTPTMEIAI